MTVKTRKYSLPKKVYIRHAYSYVLSVQWWVWLIYGALNAGAWWLPSWWWLIGSSIGALVYLLFWLVQFLGVTQLEQFKFFFARISFEIDSRHLLIRLNPKQGMPILWEQVKRAAIKKDAFVLYINKAQLIYLPFKIFNSLHERKFVETLLRRKRYIK